MASDPNASYLPGNCTPAVNPTNCYSYKFHRYQGWHFAIKTGTTNDGFDGLMTSWSTKYAVVAWVGNHTRKVDLTAARGTAMEYLTEPLVKGFMQYAHNGLPPTNWQKPADIKQLPAFIVRNHVHYGDVEPSPSTDLFPGWYQAPTISNVSQTIDKVSGMLATSCTPDSAKEYLSNSNANSFSVDKFVKGMASTSIVSGNDDVHDCNDAMPQITVYPQSTTCSSSDNGGQGCAITITVTQGTHPLSSDKFQGLVTVTADGKQVQQYNVSDSPSSSTIYYAPTSTGTVQISATVTDSVLYQSSAQTSLNVTVANGGGGTGDH